MLNLALIPFLISNSCNMIDAIFTSTKLCFGSPFTTHSTVILYGFVFFISCAIRTSLRKGCIFILTAKNNSNILLSFSPDYYKISVSCIKFRWFAIHQKRGSNRYWMIFSYSFYKPLCIFGTH